MNLHALIGTAILLCLRPLSEKSTCAADFLSYPVMSQHLAEKKTRSQLNLNFIKEYYSNSTVILIHKGSENSVLKACSHIIKRTDMLQIVLYTYTSFTWHK